MSTSASSGSSGAPQDPTGPRAGDGDGLSFSSARTSLDWGGQATRAEIDLDALTANVLSLRSHVYPATLIAVVKANAYGHGAAHIAGAALDAGASMIATYYPREAVALRESGITAPILVFGPFERAEGALPAQLNLTPTVWDDSSVDQLNAASTHKIDVHLKIDTGLHRGGTSPEYAVALARHIASQRNLRLTGAFTHFVSADDPDSPETAAQLARFHDVIDSVRKAGVPVPVVHAANSGGTLNYPGTRLSAVRCGIALYGYSPNPAVPPAAPLKPVMSLLSKVIRLHTVPVGEGVGYGHDFRAERTTRIALVPIGYGDGLHRSLGNRRGTVLIHGSAAPIVGRVSMDQITIDITDIPGVDVGSDVVLLGRSHHATQDAHELGRQAGTICYEVLTAVSARVPRVYIRDGRLLGEH